MDLARKRGIEVVERTIWPEELEGFEQFFLTGSAAEVAPVASAGPWNFEAGELTLQLRTDYLDLVNRRISNACCSIPRTQSPRCSDSTSCRLRSYERRVGQKSVSSYSDRRG